MILRAIQGFFFGVLLPFTAFRLILRKPRLMLLSSFPLIVTIGLSIWGLSALKGWILSQGMAWVTQMGWMPEGLAVQVAVFLFNILLFIIGAFTFSIVAGIVASPFNDFLAEATEPLATPPLPALLPEQTTLGFRGRSVGIDIVKTIAVGVIQIFLILAGLIVIWIPGLNVLLLLLTFVVLTYQYVSYPQTRRGIGLLESVGFLKRQFAASLGFGLSLAALFSIPVLSAFALPLAVVGGTLLYAREVAPSSKT